MSPQEIALVTETWRGVVPVRDTFAQLFYAKLFALDPGLRALFGGNLAEQGRSLVAMISIGIRNLAQPESIERALRELGQRHASYGVRPEHYETVATALILSLGLTLGEAFTPEARAAWERAYAQLAGAMQGAKPAVPADAGTALR